MIKCKLKDITTQIYDGKHGDCINDYNSGYYFISVKDLNQYEIDYKNARQIIKEDFDINYARTKLENGDTIYANTGDTIGKSIFIKDNKLVDKTSFQKSVAVIKPDVKKIEPRYLYYLLKYITPQLRGSATGSSQKNLLLSTMRNFDIQIHDRNTQIIISDILGKFDDKILNNIRIISELEAMAKTIYDYWFLQYEFPNEEGKPYKSSSGKMVYNEVLKKEIPEGWKVCTIGDIVIEKGKSPMQVGDAKDKTGKYPFFTSGSEIYEVDEFLTEGRNCYLSTGGKGNVQYYVGKSSYSTDTWAISGKNNLEDYLYLFIKSIENMLDIKYFAGTGLQHLQKDLFKDTHIVIPNEETLKMFNKISNKLFSKISKIYIENKELQKTRDYLLPLLMNGQVSFKGKGE